MSGFRLGAGLLQVRNRMQFPKGKVPDNLVLEPIGFKSKSVTSTETHYRYIEREAVSILHGLEKFHHYCFTHGSASSQITIHWWQY